MSILISSAVFEVFRQELITVTYTQNKFQAKCTVRGIDFIPARKGLN